MNRNCVQLVLVPNQQNKDPTLDYLLSLAKTQVNDDKKLDLLSIALDQIFRYFAERTMRNIRIHTIEVKICFKSNSFQIHFHNKDNLPFFPAESEIESLQDMADKVTFNNLGREGQKLTIEYSTECASSNDTPALSLQSAIPPKDYEIRNLQVDESELLTQIFHRVYGYRYINDLVYYPQKISENIKNGNLVPVVATTSQDQIIGHIGLVKINDSPTVYEAALGVVDPSAKSSGLFGKLFKHIYQLANTLPMQYCLFDFVTNHDYSQKEVAKYGTCEMSLSIGIQISQTQAKLSSLGLGEDAIDMDRYSLLISIMPIAKNPFGTDVILPIHLGERLNFLLEDLGIKWTPASRFFPLLNKGDYSVQKHKTQKAVIFDLFHPGQNVLPKILNEWKHFLRIGYQYAAIDVPLNFPGIGQLYEFFARQGFFISGFIPYKNSSQLGLRIQSIGPTRVSWENIKVSSENGKKLLQIIREDFERNCLL